MRLETGGDTHEMEHVLSGLETWTWCGSLPPKLFFEVPARVRVREEHTQATTTEKSFGDMRRDEREAKRGEERACMAVGRGVTLKANWGTLIAGFK